MTSPIPASRLRDYLEHAVKGERYPAVQLAIELHDTGVRFEDVIDDLLAIAQREVGERWFRNVLTVADEHVASGIAAAALDALAADILDSEGVGHTVVVCAEGEWHWLAAQMLGEGLRSAGERVTVLGGSTPADVVGEFLIRHAAESLAVSCSMPAFFPGVWTMVRAAHRHGIPVIAGGRAFGATADRSERLGADAWAPTAPDAAGILERWREHPPDAAAPPPALDPVGLTLIRDAKVVVSGAEIEPNDVSDQDPGSVSLAEHWELAVQALGAAIIVADDEVYLDHMAWLRDLQAVRGVDPGRQARELKRVRAAIADTAPETLTLFERGCR